MATFLKSEYGRKKMIFEDYVYVRNAFSQDKQTNYWICELNERKGRNTCTGRAVTTLLPESDNFNVAVTQNHSHPPGIVSERQRSPSTESIKSDRTEPGTVPDSSAFTDEIFGDTIKESDNEEMDQTIINEEIIKENTDTLDSSNIQLTNLMENVLESNPVAEETSILEETPPVLEQEEPSNSTPISETIVNVTSNNVSSAITKSSKNASKIITKRLFPSTPNGFILWSIEYKRKQNFNYGFAENSELQKILGRKWRSLRVEERRIWLEKAKQIREERLPTNGIPILVPRPHKKKKINILRNKFIKQNLPQNEINQNNNIGQNDEISENQSVESSSSQITNKINLEENQNISLTTSSDNDYDNEIKSLNCFVGRILLSKYRNNILVSPEELHKELANAGIFISLWNLNIYLIKMKLTKKKYLVPLYSNPNEGQFFLIGSDQEWHKFTATKYFTKNSIHELDCLKCLKLRRKERSNTWGQYGRAILRFGELDDSSPILHHPNCKGDLLEYLHSAHYSPNNPPECLINPQLEENIQESVSNNFINATPLELLEECVRINTSLQEQQYLPSCSSSNQSFKQQKENNNNSTNFTASNVLKHLLEKSKQNNTSTIEPNKEIILIDEDEEQITNTSTITNSTINEENNNQINNNDYLSKLIINLSEIAKQLNLSFIHQENSNNFILLPSNTIYSKRSLSIIPMTDNIIIINSFIGSILQETLRWSSQPDDLYQLLCALRGKCFQFFYAYPALIAQNNNCQGTCGWILRNDQLL